MSTPVLSGNVVQILHTGGDHWVLVSNCPVGRVNLYDSLYTAVSPETLILNEKIFWNAIIMLPPCAKQSGDCDCGLFAIAFCIGLVHLSKVAFAQQAMWNHLIKCFEELDMVAAT